MNFNWNNDMKNKIEEALSTAITKGVDESKKMFSSLAMSIYESEVGEVMAQTKDIKKLSTNDLTRRLETEICLSDLLNDYSESVYWYLTKNWYYVLTDDVNGSFLGISKDGKDFYFFEQSTLDGLEMSEVKDEYFDKLFIERIKRRAYRVESRGSIEYVADISGYEDISWVERGFPVIDFKTNNEKTYLNNLGELDWFKTRDWYYAYDTDDNLVISNDLYNFSVITGQTIDREVVKDEKLFQLFNGLSVDARSIHTIQVDDAKDQIENNAVDDVSGYVDATWSDEDNQVNFSPSNANNSEINKSDEEVIDGVTYPENGDVGYKKMEESRFELHSKTKDYIVEIELELEGDEPFTPTQRDLQEIYGDETNTDTFIEEDIDELVKEFERLGLDDLLESIKLKAVNQVELKKPRTANGEYGFRPNRNYFNVKNRNKFKSFFRPVSARNSKYGHKKPLKVF